MDELTSDKIISETLDRMMPAVAKVIWWRFVEGELALRKVDMGTLSDDQLKEIMLEFEEERLPDRKKQSRLQAKVFVLKEELNKAFFTTNIQFYDVITGDDKVVILAVVDNDVQKEMAKASGLPGKFDIPIVVLHRDDPKIKELLNAQAQKND